MTDNAILKKTSKLWWYDKQEKDCQLEYNKSYLWCQVQDQDLPTFWLLFVGNLKLGSTAAALAAYAGVHKKSGRYTMYTCKICICCHL